MSSRNSISSVALKYLLALLLFSMNVWTKLALLVTFCTNVGAADGAIEGDGEGKCEGVEDGNEDGCADIVGPMVGGMDGGEDGNGLTVGCIVGINDTVGEPEGGEDIFKPGAKEALV